MHQCCLETFARCLTGTDNLDGLNKGLLYQVLTDLVGGYDPYSRLDYGSVSGQDDRWKSVPGEEVR